MSEDAVAVRGLSKRYRLYNEKNQSLKATLMRGRRARYEEFWALRDIDFDVRKGETFGLIGENGSGKSTLLKCMARILFPDEGSVTTRGKISALLELGAGFHPELSGRENVYLNGAILGMSKKQIDLRLDDIIDFAGIEQFIDAPVKNYSSGMYVRLGFSVAINVDPEILLVDEVLAVGDAEFQQKCNEKITELRRAGNTIVVVSHSLGSVRNLCDRVALLEHGRLVDVGLAGEVIDKYLVDVFSESSEPQGETSRWGSGEALVERVEIIDGTGKPVRSISTGDPVTIRVHFCSAETALRGGIFLSLFTNEGLYVNGTNTKIAGLSVDLARSEAAIDFVVDRVQLLAGTYTITAGIFDEASTHIFDHVDHISKFDVLPGLMSGEEGVVSLGGVWEGDCLDAERRARG